MESPSRFVVWEVRSDQRGLVIDPKQAKLLDDVAKAGAAFDRFVNGRRVQSLLGRVEKRIGRPPATGPAPPLRSKGNEAHSTVTEEPREDGGDENRADELTVPALLEQGLSFSGNCPSCGHWMCWAVPFRVQWHPGNKAVTLLLAGFTLLLMGTFAILSASNGVGGYDHRLLAAHALRRYERKRGRKALGQIRKTQVLVLAGVAFVAASGFFAFANPNLF
jgi:hypothetical protein